MNESIQACPFCGPNMIEHLEVVDSKEGLSKVVKCWACGAIGPYGASNEELAIVFWNVRFQVEFSTTSSSPTNYAGTETNEGIPSNRSL